MNSPLPLPDHSIRLSRKARRVLLRAVPGRGLEVVIPEATARGLPAAFVPELLRRHKAWIDKALARLERLGAENRAESALPDRLLLNGGRELVYLLRPDPEENAAENAAGRAGSARIRECPLPQSLRQAAALDASGPAPEPLSARLSAAPARALRLTGPPEEHAALARAWLRREAAARLTPRLEALSARHGLPYARLAFRFQKSRWGSCSTRGAISLNVCLLFLPEELADYVLLHELCHTRHLNHSPRYWKLVFSLDPDALRKDRALRRARRYVPAWVRSHS